MGNMYVGCGSGFFMVCTFIGKSVSYFIAVDTCMRSYFMDGDCVWGLVYLVYYSSYE